MSKNDILLDMIQYQFYDFVTAVHLYTVKVVEYKEKNIIKWYNLLPAY